jgi:hypothetical protein
VLGYFFVEVDQDSFNLTDHMIDETAPNMMLLRAMLLKGAPTGRPVPLWIRRFGLLKKRLVKEGARLRARLPVYLAQRRALLDAHCPLLAPLRAIVTGYQEFTSTEELWATGLR